MFFVQRLMKDANTWEREGKYDTLLEALERRDKLKAKVNTIGGHAENIRDYRVVDAEGKVREYS